MAHARLARGLKITACIVAVVVALLWLGFFVEHLTEWFLGTLAPPLLVWAAQVAHLGILTGLLVSLRWRLTGSIVTAASAVLFFALTVWPPILELFIPTVVPALLFLAAWMVGRGPRAQRVRA
jgi:hypothetical protein